MDPKEKIKLLELIKSKIELGEFELTDLEKFQEFAKELGLPQEYISDKLSRYGYASFKEVYVKKTELKGQPQKYFNPALQGALSGMIAALIFTLAATIQKDKDPILTT